MMEMQPLTVTRRVMLNGSSMRPPRPAASAVPAIIMVQTSAAAVGLRTGLTIFAMSTRSEVPAAPAPMPMPI